MKTIVRVIAVGFDRYGEPTATCFESESSGSLEQLTVRATRLTDDDFLYLSEALPAAAAAYGDGFAGVLHEIDNAVEDMTLRAQAPRYAS